MLNSKGVLFSFIFEYLLDIEGVFGPVPVPFGFPVLLSVCERSEVQRVVLVAQPRAVITVKLTEPPPVFLDGRVLLHQQGLRDVLLIVPDHHVPLKLGHKPVRTTRG